MIDLIALWIGRIFLFCFSMCIIACLIWLTYWIWNVNLERWLGWENIQNRKKIIYYLKHKEEIDNYLKGINLEKK